MKMCVCLLDIVEKLQLELVLRPALVHVLAEQAGERERRLVDLNIRILAMTIVISKVEHAHARSFVESLYLT